MRVPSGLRGILIILTAGLVVMGGPPLAQPAPPDTNDRIERGDVLEIVVWREPDLTKTVTVRTDGRISLPLVQELQAEGLSPAQLQEEIQNRLRKYISTPVVSVIVQPVDNFVVFVLGNVERPGLYRFPEPVTVLQALAMGGRFGDFASLDGIRIIRGQGAQTRDISFNYKDVIRGRSLDQNILLQRNDVVLVP